MVAYQEHCETRLQRVSDCWSTYTMPCRIRNWRSWQFTDFWLGLVYTISPYYILLLNFHSDQFCSLVYSFSNLYFIGCIYTRYFPNVPSPTTSPSTILSLASLEVFPRYFSSNVVGRDVGGPLPVVLSSAHDPAIQQAWITCGTEQNWGPYFALATIPFMTRFLQSLRRYWDSKLPTHLINVSLGYKMETLKGNLFNIGCAGWQVRHGYGELLMLFPLETRW